MAKSKSTDHLILPKKSLMQFLDTQQFISVIEFTGTNLIEGHIVKHRPRKFHAESGYYDSEVDKIIKKMETSIGVWRKKIAKYIESINLGNNTAKIDFIEMKNFAINLISLQYNRNVMVDSGLRSLFINSKISELKELILFQRSIGNNHAIRELEFRLSQLQYFALDASEFPKFFQKKYMIDGNRVSQNIMIEEQYKDFVATILFIPDEMKASFLLTPQHYFAVDTVARIILGPRLAIGLYHKNIEIPDCRIIKVTEEEAFSFVARSIESALEMTEDGFKQLIGEESFLQKVETAIKTCNSMIKEDSESEICTIRSCSEMNENIFSILIILLYKCGIKKALLYITTELYDALTAYDWKIMLKNCGIEMAIVSSDEICNSFAKCFKTEKEAVEFLDNIGI